VAISASKVFEEFVTAVPWYGVNVYLAGTFWTTVVIDGGDGDELCGVCLLPLVCLRFLCK
jgi:hypothetical protein